MCTSSFFDAQMFLWKPFTFLDIYVLLFFNAGIQFVPFSESRLSNLKSLQKLSKSSPNAGWFLLKALRKQGEFCWEPYENSPKAGWFLLKALRKQDNFRWKLYENRMNFVESSTKTLRNFGKHFLRKQDYFCWKLYENKMTFIESSPKAFQKECKLQQY